MSPAERRRISDRAFMLIACGIVAVAATLLWTKLKLVAGVPRTVIAEPRSSR